MEQNILSSGWRPNRHVAPFDEYSNGLTQLASYGDLVFKGIQEMLFNRKTFDEHYNTIISTHGNTYNRMEKFVCGHIIKAFETIVESEGKHRGIYT